MPEVFDWAYTTDAVGNITAIADGLDPAGSRTYGYQDVHYFLTLGNGPWGALSWTYDKIGNRLSETRDGVTATYSYSPNASGGTSPKLAAVSESEGETRRHFYDAIGDLTVVAGAASKTRYRYDDAKRLSRIAHDAPDEPPALTDLRYDGRGFLRRAELRRFPGHATSQPSVETTATYSSEGLLYHRGHVERPDAAAPRGTPVTADNVMVFYFAGRPVAQVVVAGQGEVVTYLTSDHLGTPVLATDLEAAEEWSGGFEPFGADWYGGKEAEVFLRFPGQWEDSAWSEYLPDGFHYNVHRWYQPGPGRYTRVDPAGLYGSFNLYIYAEGNPTIYRDPLGLLVQLFCHLVGQGGGLSPHDIAGAIGYKHCFARVKCECEDNNYDKRLEVTGRNRGTGLAEMPENPPDYGEGHGADRIAFLPPDSDSMDCSMEDCILQEYHRRRKEGQPYGSWLSGPNSNTFANDILRACGVQEIFWPAGVPPFTEP